jgi:hypothetical protein
MIKKGRADGREEEKNNRHHRTTLLLLPLASNFFKTLE